MLGRAQPRCGLQLLLTSLSPHLCLPSGQDSTHFVGSPWGCRVIHVRPLEPCLALSELSKEPL